MLATLAQGRSLWMPRRASSYAGDVDWLFYFIGFICVLMFLIITAWMVVLIIKYRAREGHREQRTQTHNTAMELTWTIIPTLVVMAIFYFGFTTYLSMATVPPNAYEIYVDAYKWSWQFEYPNGAISDKLHLPKDRPVRLILSSRDVIHSLYVPAFRAKKDCVPGRYNDMWIIATEEGEYDLFCAEYCGTSHSEMITKVVVQDESVFAAWVRDAANPLKAGKPWYEVGEALYAGRGCATCHSIDGSRKIGPTFQNLFGRQRVFSNADPEVADEDYLRESILNPGVKVVESYDDQMPSYQGQLTEKEVRALIEYIKFLSDDNYEKVQITAEDVGEEKEGEAEAE